MESESFLKLIPGVKPGDYLALGQEVKRLVKKSNDKTEDITMSFVSVDDFVGTRQVCFWEHARTVVGAFGRKHKEVVRWIAVIGPKEFRLRQHQRYWSWLFSRVVSAETAKRVNTVDVDILSAVKEVAPATPPTTEVPAVQPDDQGKPAEPAADVALERSPIPEPVNREPVAQEPEKQPDVSAEVPAPAPPESQVAEADEAPLAELLANLPDDESDREQSAAVQPEMAGVPPVPPVEGNGRSPALEVAVNQLHANVAKHEEASAKIQPPAHGTESISERAKELRDGIRKLRVGDPPLTPKLAPGKNGKKPS